jgi:hypothetical protein
LGNWLEKQEATEFTIDFHGEALNSYIARW